VLDDVEFADGHHQDSAENEEGRELVDDQARHSGDEAKGLEDSDVVKKLVERLEQQEGLQDDLRQ